MRRWLAVLVSEDDSKRVRILVIEDSASLQNSIASLVLTETSFEIAGRAFDGIDGVQKAEVLKPDIVVIDVGLPRLDGIAAARRILSVIPTSKILFLTANRDPQIVRAALDVGAIGFVVKAEAEELLPALKAVRCGKRYLSRSVRCGAENS
jgi:two-component system, NarL family, response regulator LiaR